MRTLARALLVALAGAALVVALAVGPAAGQEKKKVVFTVGDTQDLDNPNPLVGINVPAFELWNLQYATLTDKAAKDFATEPGLASSWEGSPDKRTWTYHLRPNLKWSDGKPLTSADVAFTINRARREAWLNYTSTVQNLTATAPDPRTVVIHSSVADPKLPTMDSYILPQHIWGKLGKSAITKYAATDGVGSGPFTLEHVEKGQFFRMKANPSYWKGRPRVDEFLFRKFNNADAMVAALRRGELDAVENVPAGAFKQLSKDPKMQTILGRQGGFDELALNAGAGLKKPHPALLDLRVRQAIAYSVDKRTIVSRVLDGLGVPATAMSPSANPDWVPKIPPGQQYDFNLAKANQILDAAGYKDTDGDGIREMPGGGRPLRLRYAVRSDSPRGGPIAQFITGNLRKIGIATTQKVYNDDQLTELIGKGDYDLFVWGWTPFVDPDPMLSYFTCSQVSSDPKDPTNYFNDASWCDRTYDRLYQQQKVELNPERRRSIVDQMLTRFYRSAVYNVLYYEGDLQAYRKDRFTGFIRQPANTGPVLFTNSSQSYANLKPVTAAASSGGGSGSGAIIAIAVVVVALLVGGGFWLTRRRTAYERE
jgi:peptide/nickel transport system substrate-binding protein